MTTFKNKTTKFNPIANIDTDNTLGNHRDTNPHNICITK